MEAPGFKRASERAGSSPTRQSPSAAGLSEDIAGSLSDPYQAHRAASAPPSGGAAESGRLAEAERFAEAGRVATGPRTAPGSRPDLDYALAAGAPGPRQIPAAMPPTGPVPAGTMAQGPVAGADPLAHLRDPYYFDRMDAGQRMAQRAAPQRAAPPPRRPAPTSAPTIQAPTAPVVTAAAVSEPPLRSALPPVQEASAVPSWMTSSEPIGPPLPPGYQAPAPIPPVRTALMAPLPGPAPGVVHTDPRDRQGWITAYSQVAAAGSGGNLNAGASADETAPRSAGPSLRTAPAPAPEPPLVLAPTETGTPRVISHEAVDSTLPVETLPRLRIQASQPSATRAALLGESY